MSVNDSKHLASLHSPPRSSMPGLRTLDYYLFLRLINRYGQTLSKDNHSTIHLQPFCGWATKWRFLRNTRVPLVPRRKGKQSKQFTKRWEPERGSRPPLAVALTSIYSGFVFLTNPYGERCPENTTPYLALKGNCVGTLIAALEISPQHCDFKLCDGVGGKLCEKHRGSLFEA